MTVYADHTIARSIARQSQVARFPESGRRVPEADDAAIREVIEWPYRVIYGIHPDHVEILAAVHGRRGDLGTLTVVEAA